MILGLDGVIARVLAGTINDIIRSEGSYDELYDAVVTLKPCIYVVSGRWREGMLLRSEGGTSLGHLS